ncbi:hypothetical protein DW322_10695 [Rhodococcus rhodnii]|uniref:Uncharacterized protein n=2 Tax=Rhodococcus rhodnii TaxID=38312 RepID=R7WJ98_9NOCA|nr:hypothetical protein [Rhodococcus rhodnii]EOM75343.1 hypothetical protein Rrhod_3141 [Rhodococcus rhodnii LMG 5362]TXG90603.1 hypothetical protein DW322_10695 [Rhodococcus rhodnii]
MPAPERRSRIDVVVAVGLAVVVALTLTVVWLRSDARGTTSVTASPPVADPHTPLSVPETLQPVWSATSDVPGPVTAGGAVVTAEGGAVVGHDARTGEQAWRYERDHALCTVAPAFHNAVAVYRDARGCSQATSLRGSDGVRAAQRTNDADSEVTTSGNDTYLAVRGDTRLEVWRSDLVRTLEYGRVDARVTPDAQPRSGCTLLDADASSQRVAVVEQCPGEPSARLTLLDPSPDDAQKPEEFASRVLTEAPQSGGPVPRIVAVAGERTALYLPPVGDEGPRVGIYDGAGTLVTVSPLDAPASDDATSVRSGDTVLWWSGTDLVGFTGTDLAPRWVYPGTLGPGTVMAGQVLAPVDGGIAVLDPRTGVPARSIGLARPEAEGTVFTATVGAAVVEQIGETVTVYE